MYHEGRTYVFYRFRAPVANKIPQPLSPFFFFKCWYVMFLLAVYSSSNSLRTLMLKETSRHFSFSVFLFCSCLFFCLFFWEEKYWLSVYLKSISFRFKLPLLLTRRKMETFASCYKQVWFGLYTLFTHAYNLSISCFFWNKIFMS